MDGDKNIIRDRVSLSGHSVAFVGRLITLSHTEAARAAEDAGARFHKNIESTTSLIVLGSLGTSSGHTEPAESARSGRRNPAGWPAAARLLSEQAFLESTGLDEKAAELQRLYTCNQLSRLLGIPVRTLYSWRRRGWIKPARKAHRLLWFTFGEAAHTRQLASLLGQGLRPETLGKNLAALDGLSSDTAREQLMKLKALWGQAVMRDEGGRLIDTSGQLYIPLGPFAAGQAAGQNKQPVVSIDELRSRHQNQKRGRVFQLSADIEALFSSALEAEADGDEPSALELYARICESDDAPPEACFNYANLLYDSGRTSEAARWFLKAAESDRLYAEAWNNLGSTLVDLGAQTEAAWALQKAIEIEPDYADARYNLGHLLLSQGKKKPAFEQFKAYLMLDPDSPIAAEVKKLIQS